MAKDKINETNRRTTESNVQDGRDSQDNNRDNRRSEPETTASQDVSRGDNATEAEVDLGRKED